MTQPQDGTVAPPPGVTAALPPAVLPVTKETLLVVDEVSLPAVLVGKKNGQLPASILESTAGLSGGPTVTLVPPAMRAWIAMVADAQTHGIILQATSTADSYRILAIQTTIFHQRYVSIKQAGWVTRKCGSVTWYQVPGTASAACPGTSNHGLGLAVDVANASGGRLTWMISNIKRFGFSWEIQSESWHIRYTTGDRIPAAVLEYEKREREHGSTAHSEEKPMRYRFDKSIAGADTTHVYLTDGLRYRILPSSYQIDALHAAGGAAPIVVVNKAKVPAAWNFTQIVANLCGTPDPGELGGPPSLPEDDG